MLSLAEGYSYLVDKTPRLVETLNFCVLKT